MDNRDLYNLGKSIVRELDMIDSELKSARNLGIWDIFGGGKIVSFFKHKNMGNAQKKLDRLGRDIRRFQQGVNSTSIPMNRNIDTGSFNKFMDIFVDHQLADLYTQSKIGSGRREIKEMKREIENILKLL